MVGITRHFFAQIAVPVVKSGTDIQEPSFLHRRNRDGDWAGAKDLLEFLFGNPRVSFGLRECGFCFTQIRYAFRSFGSVDLGPRM